MLFQKSSSSESSDEDQYQNTDEMVDEFVTNHLLNTSFPRGPRPPNTDILVRANRQREEGHNRLFNDYFAVNPVYSEKQFRRRFRMKRPLFCRIMNKVVENEVWFQQRRDAAGRLGLSGLQKCTAAIRMLAYGVAPDAVDEYLRIGETTTKKSLLLFTQGVIKHFEEDYLRSPSSEDLRRILYQNEMRGFPGMIGSIDCMHWEWKNCPNAWKGQYAGRSGKASLILEAVADQDLWIWHAFFGIPGSCNDLNVLYRSPVFDDVLQGKAPPINFRVNGHEYNLGYYLTDGIYPNWATFIQGFTLPQLKKHKLFADKQAHARKDVERAFGVLQARFAIIRQPSLAYDEDTLGDIMKACIIMHNMIVEDERDNYVRAEVLRKYYEDDLSSTSATVNNDEPFEFQSGQPVNINAYLGRRSTLRDSRIHDALKHDLIEHIWEKYGSNNNNN
ncbi:protein ALP1-like [Spinacia oleracea]|uniref:Protein ALP1-like n=1 Tax=Spinacia oleracea TaxID=3562 RepID=A0A9R0I196_SPIOL|nr:protein ALP1-like [Spinacia oleracea]